MLDIKYVRQNKDKVLKAISDKKLTSTIDLDKLLEVDNKLVVIEKDLNDLRKERNEVDNIIKSTKDELLRKNKIEYTSSLKLKVKTLEQEYNLLNTELEKLMYLVPNIIHESVPYGKDDKENVVIRKGTFEPKKYDFKPKDHMELGLLHNIIDTDKSGVISGARFNYLFNEAVMLQFAIVQFTLHTLTNKEIVEMLAKKVGNPFYNTFIPVVPPVFAKSDVMKKMDRFDPIDDRYYFEKDDMLLVGSAEHTLGPLHMNEVIDAKSLPIRYLGYSTAFRREAGSYGKDTAGILRRHQFDKLEMETFVLPEYGMVEQDFLVAIQEYLVSKLEIPYQIVAICTGDMGKPDYRQIDTECFIPGQNKYRETHTSDYMTDYQSRRLNIRYKDSSGNKGFVHMNDATAFAIGRILIAILENYQQKDGSILVPKVLQPYCGFEKIGKSK